MISPTNFDEAQVPNYDLPELLTTISGEQVSQENWYKRRQELLGQFKDNVYGHAPTSGWMLDAKIDREDANAYNGLAVRQETLITIKAEHGELTFRALVHLPYEAVKSGKQVPAFVGLNFAGNHTISPDPWITVSDAWSPARKGDDYSYERREVSRGFLAKRWPILRAIAHGYAVVTIFSGEIDEDRDDGFLSGIHGIFEKQTQRNDHSWGTIAAWSWALSRSLDAMIKVEDRIDPRRVGTVGHSRMGKAALWAAACDERFAWAISNNSGCTGAALSRRCFGERLANINSTFPHWFAKAYHTFNEREDELPIDQHQLLALIAPRPLYVCSARLDQWADPVGEFTSCLKASEAYECLGKQGIAETGYPPLNQSVGELIGYHCRTGPHDMTEVDWMHYLNFLNKHGV